jgi:hypothetical protein
MNERELGDALLKMSGSLSQSDSEQLIQRLLQRDRRRLRILAAVAAILWFVAVAGIPLFFTLFTVYLLPKTDVILREMITHQQHLPPEQLVDLAHTLLISTAKLCIALVGLSVLIFLLAAWATVFLVFASQRATLGHVNTNLARIDEQLKRIPDAPQRT